MGIFNRKKKDGSKEEKQDKKTDDKKEASADSEKRAANINAAAVFSDSLKKSSRTTNLILLVSMLVFSLVIGGYGFMTLQMGSKIQGLNDNMQATVEKVDELNEIIETLTETQGEFTNQQEMLGQAVASAGTSVEALKIDMPDAAAKKVSKETDKVVSQVRSLSQIVSKQGKDITRASKIIEGLSGQLNSFESQLAESEKLNSDVEALVTLERAKYLEVLERQADLQEKQRGPAPIEVPRDPNLIFYSIQSQQP